MRVSLSTFIFGPLPAYWIYFGPLPFASGGGGDPLELAAGAGIVDCVLVAAVFAPSVGGCVAVDDVTVVGDAAESGLLVRARIAWIPNHPAATRTARPTGMAPRRMIVFGLIGFRGALDGC